jgi:hypothetical protein
VIQLILPQCPVRLVFQGLWTRTSVEYFAFRCDHSSIREASIAQESDASGSRLNMFRKKQVETA